MARISEAQGSQKSLKVRALQWIFLMFSLLMLVWLVLISESAFYSFNALQETNPLILTVPFLASFLVFLGLFFYNRKSLRVASAVSIIAGILYLILLLGMLPLLYQSIQCEFFQKEPPPGILPGVSVCVIIPPPINVTSLMSIFGVLLALNLYGFLTIKKAALTENNIM